MGRVIQFRILYFFSGPGLAVLSHGFIKKGRRVPLAEIERASIRMRKFLGDPRAHAAEIDL